MTTVPSSGESSRGPRARRSDARRNIDAILDAAGRLLPEQPRASMQEVADAAGVHRATVHRHFPSRDDLLTALRRRSLDQVQDILSDPELTTGDPATALERATAAALRLGDRSRTWRILPTYDDASDARASQLGEPLTALLGRAQEAGAVRGDVDVGLLAAAWGGMVVSTLPLVLRGDLSIDQGAAHVRRMLSAPGA